MEEFSAETLSRQIRLIKQQRIEKIVESGRLGTSSFGMEGLAPEEERDFGAETLGILKPPLFLRSGGA